jgi:hypothetical protein
MESLNPTFPCIRQPQSIPWEEQLEDHQKIEEYLNNLVFRGCTYETTVRTSRAVVKRLFKRLQIEDPNHARGRRQILIWELLDPERGPSRLGLLTSSLLKDNLAHGTRREYICELRSFCDYVLAKPNIPGSSELTIIEKYGPIALTFTNTTHQCMRKTGQPGLATLYPQHCLKNFTSSCGLNTCRVIHCLTWGPRTIQQLFSKPRLGLVQVSCWRYEAAI